MAHRSSHQVQPLRPHFLAGCSWMMIWKRMFWTLTLSLKPVTSLSPWMTQRSMSPPWRPTSPTECQPRSGTDVMVTLFTWFYLDNVGCISNFRVDAWYVQIYLIIFSIAFLCSLFLKYIILYHIQGWLLVHSFKVSQQCTLGTQTVGLFPFRQK